MIIKSTWLLSLVLLVLPFGATRAMADAPPTQPAVPQASPEEEAQARIALGERFAEIAMNFARATRYSKAGVHQATILLDAAIQMNPVEPRFMRTLALWREQLGDINGAIAAWNKYLHVKGLEGDHVAQSKLIDLYLLRLQANDQKIKYLRDMVAMPSLDDHVKAYAAARAVPLLDQRSRPEALAMLAQARALYPLPEVTLMEWQMLPAGATPVQRLAAMLNVLRANPANGDAVGQVADMLAANGLSERALTWYSLLMYIHAVNATAPSPGILINYLAERYRAGETTVANDQLDKILQQLPDYEEAWFLRLTTQRGDESGQLLRQAGQVFNAHLSDLCDRIVKESVAGAAVAPAPRTQPATTNASTTNPSTEPVITVVTPEQLDKAVARVKIDPRMKDALVTELTTVAWFELYFNHSAEASVPSLDALRKLVPADNYLLRRLQGWYDLVSGDEAGARAIFTAQQANDPICDLGLFAIEDAKNNTAVSNAIGAKILSDPRTGVEAAILYQATKGKGIKAANDPPDAAAVKTELDNFPKDWLEVIRNPQRFYSIRVEPTKIGHRLGDPMIAAITIQNESKIDITIGDLGLLKPILIFDGQIRGVNSKTFPDIAPDRIMGRLVLGPNESVSEEVRLDQTVLGDALRMRPASLILVNGDVVTNGRFDGRSVRWQAGGYIKNFEKMFTRVPAAMLLDKSRRDLFADLANGTPESKILDLELLAAYYTQYMQPNAPPEDLTFAQQDLNFIDKSRSDPSPGVKPWASYIYGILTAGQAERRAIAEMLQSGAWQNRLLALVASQNLPREDVKPLAAAAAATDTDPLVRQYAAGLLEFVQQAPPKPATLPATTAESPQTPATAPSVVPATQPLFRAPPIEFQVVPSTQPKTGIGPR